MLLEESMEMYNYKTKRPLLSHVPVWNNVETKELNILSQG